MIAYKLCRKLKNGKITSLFINKKKNIEFGIWLDAENHPTKGFSERPYWHCCSQTNAPHLSMKNRVWVKVQIKDFIKFERPDNQGGLWYLAKKIKFVKLIE